MEKQIAIVTYETPFAPGGGISAVMSHLPRALQKESQRNLIVVTPYHFRLEKTNRVESQMEKIGSVNVSFDRKKYSTQILRLKQDIEWIFIKPTGHPPGEIKFFAGQNHPYDVKYEDEGNKNILLRDSLFFCQAAQNALHRIEQSKSWTVLMQDWETAPLSLVIHSMGLKNQYTTYLTLHNAYDAPLSNEDLNLVNIDPTTCPGDTVLQRSLPLIHDPVFTVSQQFALDISNEVILARILAPHIRSNLTNRLLGIDNGTFTNLEVPKKVISAAREENYTPLKEWKFQRRKDAYQALDKITSSKDTPIWGKLSEFIHDDAPWFVMAGRDDSRQKGYDLTCNAIEKYISSGREGRFLLLPIPGEEGLTGIGFLKNLADRFPENVMVLPFIFREGYFSILQGASFGLMPSFYEPFGMANEYYLNGTSCIGRATGGISQQIIPYRYASSFSGSVRTRTDRWHDPDAPATGFLFREQDEISNLLNDWKAINSTNYYSNKEKPDRLEQRKDLQLFQELSSVFQTCLEDAAELYINETQKYYKMVINGIDHITKNFTWMATAKKYNRILTK